MSSETEAAGLGLNGVITACPVRSRSPFQRHMANPPGPRGPPLIGQAFNLDTSHMQLQFMEWQKQYGDLFMFKVLGKSYAVISHPEIIKKMFVTCAHASKLNDRPESFMGSHVIYHTQDIVFRNYDDKQRTLKLTTRDYVENVTKEEDWFYESVAKEMENVVNKLERLQDTDVDLLKLLDVSASRIMALLLCGRLLEDADPVFRCLQGFMAVANDLGTVKNQTILTAIPGIRKLPGHLKELYDRLVEEREDIRKYYIHENTSERGLVCTLMSSGQNWLTEDYIMGVIMDLTPAAVVPLQNTLSVLTLILTHHPEVQAKIRQEVDSLAGAPTIHDIPKMPYTRACVLEVKRYHTPLPISARHSNRSGDVKFEKYDIPKNTEIFTNLFGIHHDERFWDDPWSFTPERFLTPDGQLLPDDHPNMTNLVANGVGPRACLGTTFADNIIHLFAASLVSRFDILPCYGTTLPDCDPREYLPGVVTRSPDFLVKIRDVHSNT